MRGKLHNLKFDGEFIRITPADAGKTFHFKCNVRELWGSPPRMRGKQFSAVLCTLRKRITPADAGKTISFHLPTISLIGSPPRMRGKLSPLRRHCKPHRITPADAGKTTGFPQCAWVSEDHPRGCGENLVIAGGIMLGRGSPPRMRGKRALAAVAVGTVRITPADAGKTLFFKKSCIAHRDHPRGCGENVCIRINAADI